MPVDQVKDKFSLLRSRMAKESDTVLTFSSDTKLNAHAAILRLHSPRLARKLQSAQISSSSSSKKRKLDKGSSNTGTGATLKLLHMPGTSKADFLVVAQFLYPAVPLPKVSWDNLEVLLVEGRKWEMQVVLAQAAEFIINNAGHMNLQPTSRKYAFKWLRLADAANLTAASKACVARILALQPRALVAEQLVGLSQQTLVYAVERMGRVCRSIPAPEWAYC